MEPLDILAQSNQCLISDLRYCAAERCSIEELLRHDAMEFSVEGWNALLQYIFPGAPRFMKQTEARDYLNRHWGR